MDSNVAMKNKLQTVLLIFNCGRFQTASLSCPVGSEGLIAPISPFIIMESSED